MSAMALLAPLLGALGAAAALAQPPSPGMRLLGDAQALVRELDSTRYLHEGEARGADVQVDERGRLSIAADCSGWVSYNLEQLPDVRYIQAVQSFKGRDPQERDVPYPRAHVYWSYFSQLPADAPFQRIVRLADVRPGDIVVWCIGDWCEQPRPEHMRGDTGHILIVAAPPVPLDDSHVFVLALDSSSLRHYGCDAVQASLAPDARAAARQQDVDCRSYPDLRDDTRPRGGVGAGYILFGMDASGAPATFQFGPGDSIRPVPGETIRFAIVRLR
ncbi:hypothetical protein [Pyxidicoccus caerfyrddinensis]|uniref:hypothetical protein n=1 Tax=Pyxidicoccus caerfyrddinensis TaxID=2709663 RepID=UPI0013D8F2E1|nr:hypothetical protein [Pyxidicoccus caerfyrddinensis]